ncbi:CYP102A5, partial [Symbiodinium sp. KB8]
VLHSGTIPVSSDGLVFAAATTLLDGVCPERFPSDRDCIPAMAAKDSQILKLAGGMALGATALMVASGTLKKSLKESARRAASSPFEYHLAVHCSEIPSGAVWQLVKLPKTAKVQDLHEATVVALGKSQFPEDMEKFGFYPVQRKTVDGVCVKLGDRLLEVGSLDLLLSALQPEHLQVIQLIFAREAPFPSDVPEGPKAFPMCGICLPVMGTSYQNNGPYPIPEYNFARNVFPPRGEYPYGSTVRSHAGQKQSVGGFGASVLHEDAQYTETMTADASIIQELVSRAADFPKLWNRDVEVGLQDFTANGLFTSSEQSEDWKTGHSLLPRGFNQIKVKSFAPQILAKTRAFVGEWSKFEAGQLVEDVNEWLTAMTADAVVSCSMGMDMQNVERLGSKQTPHKFVETFRFGLGVSIGSITAQTEYGLKRFLPFFDAEGQLQKRYQASKKEMQRQVENLVEATRRGELGDNSIIATMLNDSGADGKHVRFGALYGHIVNLMIAGHETTAATLGFTLQLLAEHPVYEERALEEVRQVLQGRAEPSVDDVPKLQFVEQCFREALRLYSPVTSITRDVAYDTLLGGHRVYQGERINLVTRALHTNPDYWGGEFGDPLSFNPARFSPEAVRQRHPNAYHPWGFASRACIGSQFALFEAKTFLASMLIHFRLEGIPGYTMVASCEAGGASPSPENLAFRVFPRPGGPLWCDGIMRPLRAAASYEATAESMQDDARVPGFGLAADRWLSTGKGRLVAAAAGSQHKTLCCPARFRPSTALRSCGVLLPLAGADESDLRDGKGPGAPDSGLPGSEHCRLRHGRRRRAQTGLPTLAPLHWSHTQDRVAGVALPPHAGCEMAVLCVLRLAGLLKCADRVSGADCTAGGQDFQRHVRRQPHPAPERPRNVDVSFAHPRTDACCFLVPVFEHPRPGSSFGAEGDSLGHGGALDGLRHRHVRM